MFLLIDPRESKIKQFCISHTFKLAGAMSSEVIGISLGALAANQFLQPLSIQDAAAKVAATRASLHIILNLWISIKKIMGTQFLYETIPNSSRQAIKSQKVTVA